MRRLSLLLLVCVFALAMCGASSVITGAAEPGANRASVAPLSLRGPVWVIPIDGTIDLGLASFVKRVAAEAAQSDATLVLLELNTFGGRVDAATEIRDTLLGAGVPTAAFVTERAWSAGALIALAADTLWMAPGTSIGAAEPRPTDEKTVSALRAEFEAMAERVGRDPKIAAAMVDKNVVVEGVTEAGEILTLSAARAREVGFAEGVVDGRRGVLTALGIEAAEVHHATPHWAERVVRFLTEPIVSELLLSLAFLGLIAEVTSPGFGVPGIAGLSALFLFFGGRYVVGLVGWEALALFLVGLILILLEILVIPGVGVAGLLGAISMLASLFLTFGGVEEALRSIGIVFIMTLAGAFLLIRLGKRTGVWSRLILTAGQSRPDEEQLPAANDRSGLVGKEGYALTVLRPVGAVLIDGERIDALSEGGYVNAGSRVVVYRVDGDRVIVREVQPKSE